MRRCHRLLDRCVNATSAARQTKVAPFTSCRAQSTSDSPFQHRQRPLRREPNVLMLHYADMKRDLRGAVRKITSFGGVELTAAQWANVERYVSFDWMKEHEGKFEIMGHAPVPVIEKGSMVRKGKLGAAHEDGMTGEVAHHLRAFGPRILNDSNMSEVKRAHHLHGGWRVQRLESDSALVGGGRERARSSRTRRRDRDQHAHAVGE